MEIVNNRYELIKTIGHGSYGEVYKAKDLGTDRVVALKKGVNDREVETLASLDHPAFPKFYGSFETTTKDCWGDDEYNLWVAMEYVDGVNMRDYSFKDRQDTIRVGVQLFDALRYLHFKKNLVHGDLHSGNVMVSPAQAYIVDLGFTASVAKHNQYRIKYERGYIADFISQQSIDVEISKWYYKVSNRSDINLQGMKRSLRKLALA